MKNYKLILASSIAIIGLSGCASTTPTTETSKSYIIYDLKGHDVPGDIISNAIVKGIQSQTSSVKAVRDIPPYPLPTEPGRFELTRPQVTGNLAAFVGELPQRPSCKNSILTINAANTGMAAQGEKTTFFACLIPYTEGYRLSIYTTFIKKSGAFSAEMLGATLARSIVGDSSQFIPRTVNAIMEEVGTLNVNYEVVEQYPTPVSNAG
ncbi:hypothetical protein LG272_07135 [Pseudidiomarina marina]|uniref:hypothetical protein n=1 Tax=Pseudidiomarina marina TaxID=502366 RepID=UPI003850D9E2